MKDRLKEFIANTKRRNQILAGLLISIVIVVIFFSDYGLIKRLSLYFRQSELEENINRQTAVKDSLQERIDLLKKDSSLIEKLAREKYGMKKPNETIILTEEEE